MNIDRSGPILCFGEVLLRLGASSGAKLANAHSLTVHVGGAEANAGAMLAQLGRPVEMITVLPRSPLGDQCVAEIRRVGMGTAEIRRTGGRLGLYFVEGTSEGGRILYDREASAFAANADAHEWPALARGASWFHLSGINLALGGKPAETALTAVRAMSEAGVPVSFDLNYRTSLWESRSQADLDRLKDVIVMTDVLFAGPYDLARFGLDEGGPVQAAFSAFQKVKVIASTRRCVERQQLSARVDTRVDAHETGAASLGQVIDRIGSGDAFAGAVIDAILRGASVEETAAIGLAAAVMKHAIAGDRWIGTREELEAFDLFEPGDIRR
jgi:2-dehydro-3-deoxygluconokinase